MIHAGILATKRHIRHTTFLCLLWLSPILTRPSCIVRLMTITVSVLGSGSRGNATFVKTERVRLLIDAGMSRKEISSRLECIGEDPDGIDAVLITHEHSDHSGGLKMLVKELPFQAFLTRGTIGALHADEYELNGSKIIPIPPGVPFTLGDVEVFPFSVPHDAAEPVAFSITVRWRKTHAADRHRLHAGSVAEKLRGSRCADSRIESRSRNAACRAVSLDSETTTDGPVRTSFQHRSRQIYPRTIRRKRRSTWCSRISARETIIRQLRDMKPRGHCATVDLEQAQLTVTSQDEPTAPIRL